jgi:hypothetical protein
MLARTDVKNKKEKEKMLARTDTDEENKKDNHKLPLRLSRERDSVYTHPVTLSPPSPSNHTSLFGSGITRLLSLHLSLCVHMHTSYLVLSLSHSLTLVLSLSLSRSLYASTCTLCTHPIPPRTHHPTTTKSRSKSDHSLGPFPPLPWPHLSLPLSPYPLWPFHHATAFLSRLSPCSKTNPGTGSRPLTRPLA